MHMHMHMRACTCTCACACACLQVVRVEVVILAASHLPRHEQRRPGWPHARLAAALRAVCPPRGVRLRRPFDVLSGPLPRRLARRLVVVVLLPVVCLVLGPRAFLSHRLGRPAAAAVLLPGRGVGHGAGGSLVGDLLGVRVGVRGWGWDKG